VLSAEAVLLCAFTVLGRSGRSFPPIEFVQTPPVGVSARAEAFVRDGEQRVFLVTSTAVFRRAQHATECYSDITTMRKLASVLVHEKWHLDHGLDESGAYAAQLTALASMGAGPNNAVYDEVKQSMLWVQARQRSDGRGEVQAGGWRPCPDRKCRSGLLAPGLR
jgi:hypothetical protein